MNKNEALAKISHIMAMGTQTPMPTGILYSLNGETVLFVALEGKFILTTAKEKFEVKG